LKVANPHFLPTLQDNLDDPAVESKAPGYWFRWVEEIWIECIICDVNSWLLRRSKINMKKLWNVL
jgi:hypothetical protein